MNYADNNVCCKPGEGGGVIMYDTYSSLIESKISAPEHHDFKKFSIVPFRKPANWLFSVFSASFDCGDPRKAVPNSRPGLYRPTPPPNTYSKPGHCTVSPPFPSISFRLQSPLVRLKDVAHVESSHPAQV